MKKLLSLLLVFSLILVSVPLASYAYYDNTDDVVLGKVGIELLAAKEVKSANNTVTVIKGLRGEKMGIAGRTYSSGIQLSPSAENNAYVKYSIKNMNVERFYSCVGKDDTSGNNQPVIFKVYADDIIIYTSDGVSVDEGGVIDTVIPDNTETVKLEAVWQSGDSSIVNFADAGFMYTPSSENEGVVYLSDMNIDFSACATNSVILDKNLNNNGPITIEGQQFEKGISLHPFSDNTAVYIFDITNSGAKTFQTYAGQCDTAGAGGNGVTCRIYIDGMLKYENEFQYNTPAEKIELDVSSAAQIVLQVDPNGNYSSDAFSFGDAKLILNNPQPDQYLSYNTIDLTEYEYKDCASAGTGPWLNSDENNNPIIMRNKTFNKGFGLHPVGMTEIGYIEYDLSSLNADKFTVKVGKTNQAAGQDVIFKVYADGILVQETNPMLYGEWYTLSVDVRDVKILRIVVDPNKNYTCDGSAFCEPTLYYSTETGSLHIDSPYIKDSDILYNTKTVNITGRSWSVDEINVLMNGVDTDVTPIIDDNGNFTITLNEFDRSYSVITLQGIVAGEVKCENSIAFILPNGNVLSIYQMTPESVSSNGEIFYGKNPYYNKTTKLEIGSGAFNTTQGYCIHPNAGAPSSQGSFDISYSLADYEDYTYVEVTVGRDDRAPISWGQQRGSAMCYILCDDKVVASTSDFIGAGEYEVLSADIPEGTQTLTFRTSNADGVNASDYIDWLEPVICKNKASFYRTEQTLYSEQDSQIAASDYSFAARFNAEASIKAITFTASAIDKTLPITAKLYRFLYSRDRSMQEEAIVENTFIPVDGGTYTLDLLSESSAGEYLLVIENATGIKYSPSDKGAVYINGECVNGFADILVAFSTLANNYFDTVSQEGETYNTTSTSAAEKERARTQIESYLNDLSTFPSSVTIGEKNYTGFAEDFTEVNRTTSEDGTKEMTVITLEHTSGLVFELTVVFYPDYAAFDWVANFTNPTDANSPMVSDFYIADIDLEGENPYFYTSHGETPNITTYLPLNYHLKNGDSYFYDANTGRSSEEDSWPYYNIEYGDKGMFAAVGWPGWWESNLSYSNGVFNFSASQSVLNSYLEPGETFRTPLMAFVLYDGRDLSRATNLWRKWFIDCNMHTNDGELFEPGIAALTTQYTHESLNTTEDMQKSIMQTFVDYGIELDYWWMDAGWYVLPDYAWDNVSPWLFTGDWEVDSERFPTGLRSVSELAEEYGIKTVLWFEPERVGIYVSDLEELSENSDYVIKPEWLCAINENYEAVEGSSPFNVLDLSNDECLEWLISRVTEILINAKISIYREDFNIAPSPAWQTQDGSITGVVGRSGSVENKWVQGHLKYWDAILALDSIEAIDSCASGGHRLDLECMRRAITLHEADYDYTDQVAKQVMTYTVGQWLPYFGTFTGPELYNPTKYDLRSCYRPYVALAYKVEDSQFDENDAAIVRAAVDEFNSIKQYYYSDLYQLTDWNISQDKWYSYEYFEPEWESGYAMVYRRDGDNAPSRQYIHLKGLDEDASYLISINDANKTVVMTGLEAMERGVSITLDTANSSEIIRFSIIDEADLSAAEIVISKINNLGEITIDSENAVIDAREAFDALTDAQKQLVNNEAILTVAETKIIELKNESVAKYVVDLINALGEIKNLEQEADVIAAREAFDTLTDAQKQLVNNEDILIEAEKAIFDLKNTPVYGEVDGKDGITASDALLTLQAAVNKITLTPNQAKAADVNNDDFVTAADALLILQYSVNKIDVFPIQNK